MPFWVLSFSTNTCLVLASHLEHHPPMTGPTFACPERFVRRVEELISGDGPSIRQRRLNDDRVVYSTYDVMRNALYWPTMSSIYSAHSRVLSGKYGDELRPLVKEVLFDGYVKETPCMDATGLVRLLSVINPSENEASLEKLQSRQRKPYARPSHSSLLCDISEDELVKDERERFLVERERILHLELEVAQVRIKSADAQRIAAEAERAAAEAKRSLLEYEQSIADARLKVKAEDFKNSVAVIEARKLTAQVEQKAAEARMKAAESEKVLHAQKTEARMKLRLHHLRMSAASKVRAPAPLPFAWNAEVDGGNVTNVEPDTDFSDLDSPRGQTPEEMDQLGAFELLSKDSVAFPPI